MRRTRVRLGRVAVAAVVVSGLVGATARVAAGLGGPEPVRPEAAEFRYVVRAGDTLWEIARAVVGPEGDPRPAVEEIRSRNRLHAADHLLPGTELLIPDL